MDTSHDPRACSEGLTASYIYGPCMITYYIYGERAVAWGLETPVCSEDLTASQNAPNGSYGSYDHSSTCMGNA